MKMRIAERSNDTIRPITISLDALGYASASVLLTQGNTKVLASVSMQPGVPPFLKGQGTGWLSAEYAMLPCATQQRTQRESSSAQRNSRSVEISRLIGRCLRTCVDLSKLREKTVLIDCDVLQADGGTRVACLTAASLALEVAYYRWLIKGYVEQGFFKERIAAISVGLVDGSACVDLSYEEDSVAHSDFNIVMTKAMGLIEIQGTAEKEPLPLETFDSLKKMAQNGIVQVFNHVEQELVSNKQYQELLANAYKRMNIVCEQSLSSQPAQQKTRANSPFTLGNRLQNKL